MTFETSLLHKTKNFDKKKNIFEKYRFNQFINLKLKEKYQKMDPIDTIDNTLIKKETLYPGSKFVNFKNGTKVKIFFFVYFQLNFLINFLGKISLSNIKM